MKIFDQTSTYITYEYDSPVEFSEHMIKNIDYFIGSFFDDNTYYSDFDIKILDKNNKKKIATDTLDYYLDFISLKSRSKKEKLLPYNQDDDISDETVLRCLIDTALENGDKSRFIKLSSKLNKINKLINK